jgi:hypothetical protein
MVLAVPLEEVSAKVRTGPPLEDEGDRARPKIIDAASARLQELAEAPLTRASPSFCSPSLFLEQIQSTEELRIAAGAQS